MRHPDDDEKGNDSDDGFDVSSDEDEDASGGFGTHGAAKIKFQISPATTAAAAATPTFAIAPPGATPAGVPALPAPGMETSSTLTPAPGTVTSSTLTSTSPAAVADPFGVGFASGFGGGAAAASAATDAVPVPTIDLDANDPFGGVVMTPEDEVDEDPFGDASEDEGEEESDAFARRATELDVDDPFGGGDGAFQGGAFGGVVGDGSSSVAVATPVAFAGGWATAGDDGRRDGGATASAAPFATASAAPFATASAAPRRLPAPPPPAPLSSTPPPRRPGPGPRRLRPGASVLNASAPGAPAPGASAPGAPGASVLTASAPGASVLTASARAAHHGGPRARADPRVYLLRDGGV